MDGVHNGPKEGGTDTHAGRGLTDVPVRLSVPVFPTEEENRVVEALLNIFPEAEGTVEWSEGVVVGDADERIPVVYLNAGSGLEKMRRLLVKQRIRDSARSHLLGLIDGTRLVFFLSKQAACVGRVNFSDGKHPLGDIKVELEGNPDGLRHLIQWLTYIPAEYGGGKNGVEGEDEMGGGL